MSAQKLPLWRLITGLAIFALLFTILGLLAPTYIENYRLSRYVRSLSPADADETLRTEAVTRAHQLGLPLQTNDIEITRASGKPQLHSHYKVKFDLWLYPVDLHMSL